MFVKQYPALLSILSIVRYDFFLFDFVNSAMSIWQ